MLLKKKISRTTWIASHEQIADCLTKQGAFNKHITRCEIKINKIIDSKLSSFIFIR